MSIPIKYNCNFSTVAQSMKTTKLKFIFLPGNSSVLPSGSAPYFGNHWPKKEENLDIKCLCTFTFI